MAAFPPPAFDLAIPSPLLDLLLWCHIGIGETVSPFNVQGQMRSWLLENFPDVSSVALRQFEELLSCVYRHRGPIRGRSAPFTTYWYTPYDCLASFLTWRREIASALAHFGGKEPQHLQWLTGDVIALRDAIDGERAFDRLPILADALEEAGCDNPVILTPLREPYDHAHHCWVIDLLSCGTK